MPLWTSHYHICVFVSSETKITCSRFNHQDFTKALCYGDGLVNKIRKFEKFDIKYREALLDLKFLQSCKKEKLILKFLQFKVANKRLESSEAYLSSQRCLWNQEIIIKYITIDRLNIKITSMKNNLHKEKGFIDHAHIFTKLLVSNVKNISTFHKKQGKKLHNLFFSYHNSVIFPDPDKVIFNFPNHALNTTEKFLSSKAFHFVISLTNINYLDFILPFELLYRDVDSLYISDMDIEFTKSRLKDSAFSSYKVTGKTLVQRTCPKRNLMHRKSILKTRIL